MTAPGQPMHRDQAFRMALVVERMARTDAGAWVRRLRQQAHLVAHGRAAQVIEPQRTTPDPLRTALSREWYVRVFEDQVRQDLGVKRPEIAVTPTETEHVAECLRDGVAYRIHGPGGSLVLNPDGPQQVPGQTNYADRAEVEPTRPDPPEQWHRAQLERLVQTQDQRRQADERMVAAAWSDLTPEQRTAFAAYLHQQQGTPGLAGYPQADTSRTETATAHTYTATGTGNRNPVTGPPREAAAAAFGHQSLNVPAEVNTARALVAKAFPKNGLSKPPTITGAGEVRTTGRGPAEKRRDTDRGR